jgi:hypothetical protein
VPIVPSRFREVQELIEQLSSASASSRESAVARLILLGERAIQPLLASLPQAPARGRLAALAVLDSQPPPGWMAQVPSLLRDRSPEVAARAAGLLGKALRLGAVEALDPLLEVLFDEGVHEATRLAALEGVRALPDAELQPILERLRRGSNPVLARRASAPEAPARPGPLPAGVEAIPLLHDAIRTLAQRAAQGQSAALAEERARLHLELAARGSRIALYDLREMLDARPPRAGGALLAAATQVGDASFVPTLARLACDAPPLLPACAEALAAIVRRERLRKTSRAVRAVRPEHRRAFEALWERARRSAASPVGP